ncbi:uncharacterized protein ALTATR162_LOCUS2416 [Alternaria atra]|uniref:Uncharacterized protein n=1 Tax=Alternaria atra TaxID=119953 RepID=A0A8J2MXC1_9PLEO|nr:uncharacterized protein ALTATR162_LOCUS2416 [Alternaria atra]CAG5149645.1 unnamed protein product [Alternaria atra]
MATVSLCGTATAKAPMFGHYNELNTHQTQASTAATSKQAINSPQHSSTSSFAATITHRNNAFVTTNSRPCIPSATHHFIPKGIWTPLVASSEAFSSFHVLSSSLYFIWSHQVPSALTAVARPISSPSDPSSMALCLSGRSPDLFRCDVTPANSGSEMAVGHHDGALYCGVGPGTAMGF